MDATEKKIIEIIDQHREEILAFGRDIYTHAELGYKEHRTAEKFNEFIRDKVEKLDTGIAITGSKAYINREKKDNFSLAVIGELDALRIPSHKYANPETQGAHCCGHHIQLTGVIGAAFALTDPEIADKLDGQLIFMTTPAEEYGELEFKNSLVEQGKIRYGGGKCEMIRIGAFDDVDAAIAHHTAMDGISVGSGSGNGFVSKVIRIKGKASHAAAAKEEGINALYAANLGLQALAFNKETFYERDCVRVHPIMTKGGDLVNVIPEEAVIETLVRGKTLEAFADAAVKTDRSFKAGAMALGAGYRIETLPGYLPSLPQAAPQEMIDVIEELIGRKVPEVSPDRHEAGSTDVGDVQHLLPVVTFHTGGVTGGGLHQSDFDVADEEEAYILTSKIFALSVYRFLRNGAKTAKSLKAAHRPVFQNKEEYIAFMEKFFSVEEA